MQPIWKNYIKEMMHSHKEGFISYMIILIGMATISIWAAWQSMVSITYQSMIDEYRFVQCQYGIERGMLLATRKEYFLAHQKEITGSGSPKLVVEDKEDERITVIYYKKNNTQYRIRLVCEHMPTGIHIQKDIYAQAVYREGILQEIQIKEVVE